jgi:hypothetical protein
MLTENLDQGLLGDVLVDGKEPYLPDPLRLHHTIIMRYLLFISWQNGGYVDPPGHVNILKNLPAAVPQAERDRRTRAAGRAYMTNQQDAGEFQRKVDTGITDSYDTT